VDISGSTAGAVLDRSKAIVRRLIGSGSPGLLRALTTARTIGWDTRAALAPLDTLRARGGTDPACIFDVLPAGVTNLLITTDGEIPSVEATRRRIAPSTIVNCIAVLITARGHSPARLSVSVFFPFLEHCESRGGAFYLLHWDGAVLALLMRRVPPGVADGADGLPVPPSEYAEGCTWEGVPAVRPEQFSAIAVPRGSPPAAAGEIVCPGMGAPLEVRALASAVARRPELAGCAALDGFVRDVVPAMLGMTADAEAVNALREIVHAWKRAQTETIEREITESEGDTAPLLREFEELSQRRVAGTADAAGATRLAALTAELLPKLRKRDALRNQRLLPLSQLHAQLME
jgi:hypothetical protein